MNVLRFTLKQPVTMFETSYRGEVICSERGITTTFSNGFLTVAYKGREYILPPALWVSVEVAPVPAVVPTEKVRVIAAKQDETPAKRTPTKARKARKATKSRQSKKAPAE